MSYRKVIKSKLGSDSFRQWSEANINPDAPDGFYSSKEEILKAQPDLAAAPEIKTSPELEAALEVLNNGGLTQLTAIQQKVFQLHVVEGMSLRAVGKHLGITFQSVAEHVQAIGKRLRALAEKRL